MSKPPSPLVMKVSKAFSQAILVGGALMFSANVMNGDDLVERPIRNTLLAGAYVYMLHRTKRDMITFTGYMADATQHTPLAHHRHEAAADFNAAGMLAVATADFLTKSPEAHLAAAAVTGLIGGYMFYSTYDHQKKARQLNAANAPQAE